MTGGVARGKESQSFRLPPHSVLECSWRCEGFGDGSQFRAVFYSTWSGGSEWEFRAPIVDTRAGGQPTGDNVLGNDSNQESRCTVRVWANGCSWTLRMMVGAAGSAGNL